MALVRDGPSAQGFSEAPGAKGFCNAKSISEAQSLALDSKRQGVQVKPQVLRLQAHRSLLMSCKCDQVPA